jgi:outer membrane protein OmpA-like peptidoglycan-associated protein
MDTSANAPKNMVITITDNISGNVVGVYKPNSKTGKYSYILTPGKSYNISYEADGMLFYSENRYISEETKFTETDKAVKLPSVGVGSKVVLNNLFFDFDQTELRPNSKTELERIYNFMVKNPNVSVEMSGYADSKGSDEYNKKLSKARAQSVVDYLIKKGVSKERMVAVGYGEIKTAAPQKKTTPAVVAKEVGPNAGRELDRRVELKIINVKQ